MSEKEQDTTENATEQPSRVVLELRGVSYFGGPEGSIPLTNADLVIRERELVTLHIDQSVNSRSTASLLQGLSQPYDGEVLFRGQSWLGSNFTEHFQMRSKIGRVFEGQAWIQNLNVSENIFLACQHHGVDQESIDKDVAFWANFFGIVEISRERPAFLKPSRLQLHQWVRAFIGNPELLILERPMKSLSSGLHPRLIAGVNEARRRGAAVLWISSSLALKNQDFPPPHSRYELRDKKLVPMRAA